VLRCQFRNIAEGKGRRTDREFLLFLHHARGSIFEVETQLTIARMLSGLIKAISPHEGKQAA